MNIVRKIEVVGALESDRTIGETNTVFMDTTGVGLPSSKRKIAVGETFTFRPSFNVPALPPNMEVPGLMRTAYLLKISVGRAHNYVIASLSVPITIVTDIIDVVEPVVSAPCEGERRIYENVLYPGQLHKETGEDTTHKGVDVTLRELIADVLIDLNPTSSWVANKAPIDLLA
ncbi:hypothetical protein ANCDUO_14055 [Ancylostoma duodenale]|uniref:Arrestin domain protein n=1 Tax=Ancylostoma duodenale TaxID=51022 RepID=A0A0C2GF70_9BILA|nr:hypothetical protein ANCDUO_14055 [Ancylostoma duodenale]